MRMEQCAHPLKVCRHRGEATVTNPHQSFVSKGKFPKIKVSQQLCNKTQTKNEKTLKRFKKKKTKKAGKDLQ